MLISDPLTYRPIGIDRYTGAPIQDAPAPELRSTTTTPAVANAAALGATPSQGLDTYVPVSAKAQYEAARDYMASEAMRKMGRKGVATRTPSWLQNGGEP